MVDEILTGAGFKKNETYIETLFKIPPKKTYAIYLDSTRRYGADLINLLEDHSITIELYSTSPDPDSENKIEEQLDARGLEYDKQPRDYIQSEGLFIVIYEFNYIQKKGA